MLDLEEARYRQRHRDRREDGAEEDLHRQHEELLRAVHVEERCPEGLERPGHADAAEGNRDLAVLVTERLVHPRRRATHDDVEWNAHREVERRHPEKGVNLTRSGMGLPATNGADLLGDWTAWKGCGARSGTDESEASCACSLTLESRGDAEKTDQLNAPQLEKRCRVCRAFVFRPKRNKPRRSRGKHSTD